MKFDVQKYFEISTVHGLAYISKRFHFVERIFWFIALIFSVICASNLIVELIIKIKNFPIVTYLSDQSYSVSEVNFPAITVCPQHNYEIPKSNRPAARQWSVRAQYEKHTIRIYYLERPEIGPEYIDEMKYGNISYAEFVDRVENGNIKPEDLGTKILKRLQVIDLITNRGIFEKINFSIPTDDFLEIANQFAKELTFDLRYNWINREQQYVTEVVTQWGLCFTHNLAFSHDSLKMNKTSDDFHYVHTLRWYQDDNVSGWGAVHENKIEESSMLQLVYVTTSPCVSTEFITYNTANHFCAGAPANSTGPLVGICTTDVGSPLVFNNLLIGIPFHHDPRACGRFLDGYMRITSYRAWILGNIPV